MTIDRIFLAYMAVMGATMGAAIAVWPQMRDFRLQPYFWVLIAMALFEVANHARGHGAPGTMITMPARLIGFAIGIGLLVLIPWLAGSGSLI